MSEYGLDFVGASHQFFGFLADGTEHLFHVVKKPLLALQAAHRGGRATRPHPFKVLSRREITMVTHINIAILWHPWVFPALAALVGFGRSELLPDAFWRLENTNGVAQALRHLIFAVEAEDALGFGHISLAFGEDLAIASVETPGNLAGELDVLNLILAYGNSACFVEENVGSLEDRIGEEPDVDVLLVLAGLLLKLGHPGQIPEHGYRSEHPGQLGMFWDFALDKKRALARVETGGDIGDGGFEDSSRHLAGFIGDGRGVMVDDAEEAFVVVEELDPVGDGTEVVPDVDFARRLDAGENPDLALFVPVGQIAILVPLHHSELYYRVLRKSEQLLVPVRRLLPVLTWQGEFPKLGAN